MKSKPRYVFDTNVIISAVLFEQSTPGRAFYAALDRGELLVSQATILELSDVLNRKKFDRYLTGEEREQFLVMLLRDAVVVDITEDVRVCRDPKDDRILELAVNGGATCIVTGDEDLLVLHPFRGIPILPPASFIELIKEQHG
jgi:putative PIN family toxin of toxin-antitoxin system